MSTGLVYPRKRGASTRSFVPGSSPKDGIGVVTYAHVSGKHSFMGQQAFSTAKKCFQIANVAFYMLTYDHGFLRKKAVFCTTHKQKVVTNETTQFNKNVERVSDEHVSAYDKLCCNALEKLESRQFSLLIHKRQAVTCNGQDTGTFRLI